MEWLYNNAGLVIVIVLGLINIAGWIITNFNKAYKIKKNNEEFHETVDEHSKIIEVMSSKIDNVTSVLTDFVSENKKNNQVIFRDKIYDSYKLTLQKGYILEKDSKNYHYALERYKANEGNSYICDEIEPRMKTFPVFNTDDEAEESIKLSR
jgi:hypothetical protein